MRQNHSMGKRKVTSCFGWRLNWCSVKAECGRVQPVGCEVYLYSCGNTNFPLAASLHSWWQKCVIYHTKYLVILVVYCCKYGRWGQCKTILMLTKISGSFFSHLLTLCTILPKHKTRLSAFLDLNDIIFMLTYLYGMLCLLKYTI